MQCGGDADGVLEAHLVSLFLIVALPNFGVGILDGRCVKGKRRGAYASEEVKMDRIERAKVE
jgi:hypothetical protein